MSIHSLGISTSKPKHWEILLKGLRSGFCEIAFLKNQFLIKQMTDTDPVECH